MGKDQFNYVQLNGLINLTKSTYSKQNPNIGEHEMVKVQLIKDLNYENSHEKQII